jgi:tetratricopeptide (TPR) repeat protein
MAPSAEAEAEAQEPKPSSARPGKAGRTNYDQWDKVTRTLVDEVEQDDQRETEASKKALGLDGKYAQSQDHADERKKATEVKKAKKVLDNYLKRESAVRTDLKGILGPPPSDDTGSPTEEEEPKSSEAKIVRITRELMDAGKRVVAISDTSGASQSDTIVLTADLSLLESKMKTNSTMVPKKYAEDSENDVVEAKANTEDAAERKIFGVIKCFLSNVHNCTVLIKCKIISGTIEMSHCTNVVVKIERDATVASVQADLCEDIALIFNDAPSGKNGTTNAAGIAVDTSADSKNRIYWGQDKEDRIFHAGVKNMKVQINRDGFLETERICDYAKDGAKAIGNATEKEFQFVTSCLNEELITEAVVREGSTTGQNARPLTKRELEEEKVKRGKAEGMAVNMAENMFKFKEVNKDGAKKVIKKEQKNDKAVPIVEDVQEEVEEIYASMSKEDIDAVVKECEKNKTRGNEAFGNGEYAQAILLYSLALDKADELPDDKNDKAKKQLFVRDLTLSNRAAAFLKLGQHEKAAADAKLAHEYNDQNVKAFFRHGLALHAMKQYTEAIPILAQAHKLEPKNKSIKEALQFAEMRFNQDLRKRMQG